MRARPGLACALLAFAGMLGGCASSGDTIVLLPKADGSTGAIAATRGGSEVLLDSAYASARPTAGGRLQRKVSTAEEVQKRFGAVLASMPPPAKSFTVYFLSGGDEFTPESTAALAAMLEELRQRPAPEVSVIGHTDRVGSDDENDALSLQRAERVKQMLVGMGVPADQVSAAGRGWREPLVPTGRGMDEPRNRRVEVSVR